MALLDAGLLELVDTHPLAILREPLPLAPMASLPKYYLSGAEGIRFPH
jgi:hypothetical protein